MRLTATTKYIFWLALWCEEEIGKHTYYDLLLASLNKSPILSHCVKENSSNEKYFGKHPDYYKVLIGKTFVLVSYGAKTVSIVLTRTFSFYCCLILFWFQLFQELQCFTSKEVVSYRYTAQGKFFFFWHMLRLIS